MTIAFLIAGLVAGCGRTPFAQIPIPEDAGPEDAGPADAGPPLLRCGWDYGAEEATFRELPAAGFAVLGAYVEGGARLRVLSRTVSSADWVVDDFSSSDLVAVDSFDVPSDGGNADSAGLFSLGDLAIEVRSSAFGCEVRAIQRPPAGGSTFLAMGAFRPRCLGFATDPDELVVTVEAGDMSTLHALSPGTPPEEGTVIGPIPLGLGPAFGFREPPSELFAAVHLPSDGTLSLTRFPREGPSRIRVGRLPAPAQLAPDPDAGRVYALTRDAGGRLALGIAALEADGLESLSPLSPTFAFTPAPERALPLVQNDLLAVTDDNEVRFVPIDGGTVTALGPPAPDAQGVVLVADPAERRAAVVYGTPTGEGRIRLGVRRLVCRL